MRHGGDKTLNQDDLRVVFEDDGCVVIYVVRHGLYGEGDTWEEAMDDVRAAWAEWGGEPAVLEAALFPSDEWIAGKALERTRSREMDDLGAPKE